MHTHVVVSNKVFTVQDGKWRTLAGRPMHQAVVAISEMYNAVLADQLTRTLGLTWEARDRGRDRSPAWEITGVPQELMDEFSTRTRHIEAEKERLIAEYVAQHCPAVNVVPWRVWLLHHFAVFSVSHRLRSLRL